jgi:hypothetical protein
MAHPGDGGAASRAEHRPVQLVLVPPTPRTLGPGHQAVALPGQFAGHELWLHTLAPFARAEWPGGDCAVLLVLTDGRGKATLDGAAQRVSAPCVLQPPAGGWLQITNQGPTPMRVLAWVPSPAAGQAGDGPRDPGLPDCA